MKHRFLVASCVARAVLRDACAARLRGKPGEGEISTDAVESILAHPGEPFFAKPAPQVPVKHRTRAAVENSYTAVQHLTNPLFLSKPVEPPL